MQFNKSYYLLTILLLATEFIIGLYMHDSIIRPYGGDFLVVILLYCFVKSFLNTPVFHTAVSVLIFAYVLEVLQYFNLVKMLGLEQYSAARMMIGTQFAWTDLLAYTLGIGLVLWVELQRTAKHKHMNPIMTK